MPFEPGRSGNPAGRKPGKPNSNTLAVRERIKSDVDPIAFLGAVMKGAPIKRADSDEELTPTLTDMIGAAKVLAAKVAPDAKDAPVPFGLVQLATAADATTAMGELVKQVAAGAITPAEATACMTVLKSYTDALQTSDFERRISEIEQRLAKP